MINNNVMKINWRDIKESIESIAEYEGTSSDGDIYWFNDEFDYQGNTIYAWGSYVNDINQLSLCGISCDDKGIDNIFNEIGLYRCEVEVINAK